MIKTTWSPPSTPTPSSPIMDQIKSMLLLLILISKIQPSCFFFFLSHSTNHHSHYLPLSIFLSLPHPPPIFNSKNLFSFTKFLNFPSPSIFQRSTFSSNQSPPPPPPLLLSLISNCSLKAQIPPHHFPFFFLIPKCQRLSVKIPPQAYMQVRAFQISFPRLPQL